MFARYLGGGIGRPKNTASGRAMRARSHRAWGNNEVDVTGGGAGAGGAGDEDDGDGDEDGEGSDKGDADEGVVNGETFDEDVRNSC